jgi:hypothetical protein
MRTHLLAALLFALPSLALADNDTAYKALRVFGKQQGDKLLNRVVELRGRNGVPQPQVWKITASDPAARGGLQEIEVQRGRIISQRTPTAHANGFDATMDLNQLNLDSDGAFTVADQEMRQHSTPFDRVDYVLRSPGQGRPPVWHLELFDHGGKVAAMQIAADSGAILDRQRYSPDGPPEDHRSDRDYVEHQDKTGWSKPGEPFRGVDDFFHRLGKRFEHRSNQLKNFFTGSDDR